MDVVSRLKRCLLNEFFAPEILTFEADLVERIQEAIRNQVRILPKMKRMERLLPLSLPSLLHCLSLLLRRIELES
jgi:hypothetical protein